MAEEKFSVLEWSIENFSCWNDEIHGKVITSPESAIYRSSIELFPRGVSGHKEHLEVRIKSNYSCDLCFIGSDGSILCTQQVELGEEKSVSELLPGPKFEDVMAHIRKNEALHRDQLTLQFRWKSSTPCVEYIRTKIDAFQVSFKTSHKMLKYSETRNDRYLWLSYPLDEGEMGELTLTASKTQINDCGSKIKLTLEPSPFERNVFVLTRVTVLNNEEVVRIEEDGHLFYNGDSWTFSNSLTSKEVRKEEFTLILHFKITYRNNLKHSCSYHYRYQSFTPAFSLKPSNIFISSNTIDSKASNSKNLSNVVLNQSDNSLKNLSEDFMCLYQDQDFSDLQLKCDNVSFEVHRNILSARSPVFKTMLSCDMQEAASNKVDITDLDPSTLGLFLTYLYTGGVEDLQGESALNLYYAADKYQVPYLKKECADFLCDNVSVSNVCDILSLADKHQDDQLTSAAHEFILKNFNEVLRSAEWNSFTKSEPSLVAETVTHIAGKSLFTISKAP